MDISRHNLDIVKEYHQQTKHHYHRYANALGFMDWNSQPDPFRRFLGTELISLPLQEKDHTPLYKDIFIPEKVPAQLLNKSTLAHFLESSLAISAWKKYVDAQWALRINPSSGNLHPTEGYIILPKLDGVNSLPGVYHYAPKEHALEKRAECSDESWNFSKDIFFVGLTSINWREVWKYGERGFRYCQHDCGHAYMALDIAAKTLGWQIVLLNNISDDQLSKMLGLNRIEDFVDEEKESPELLAMVVTNPHHESSISITDDFIKSVISGHWYGQTNRLSRDHHHWEIIDQVDVACQKPETNFSQEKLKHNSLENVYKKDFTAYQVIKKRRSAVDMDGQTTMTKEQFYQMLLRVADDFDGVPWDAKIHLCLFVHRVVGLPPGLYILVRNKMSQKRLHDSMDQNFKWEKPRECPASLNLFLLVEGDFISISKAISCGQDIAGDGAFSLGMIADFAQALEEHGAWFYKRLFWETGMVGQLLYLEAEAIGISATGIGCFFDDPMHELLGLRDNQFQSLYHFTVGGALVDDRLTTLPAYSS